MADTKTIIEQAYSAFNKRDIDGALACIIHEGTARAVGIARLRRSCSWPGNVGHIRRWGV